jgi:hypothetical protein
VGWPCIRAIVAQRIMPGVLDRVLARTGFSSQQTDEPAHPDAPQISGTRSDWGAHGRFDRQAHSRSRAASLARTRRISPSPTRAHSEKNRHTDINQHRTDERFDLEVTQSVGSGGSMPAPARRH